MIQYQASKYFENSIKVRIVSDKNINLRVKIAQMVHPVLQGRPLSLETLQFPSHEILCNANYHMLMHLELPPETRWQATRHSRSYNYVDIQ